MRYWPLLIFVFCNLSISAQNKAIDSLQSVFSTSKDDETRTKLLINLCWEYRFLNADTARVIGFRALELAKKTGVPQLEVEAIHNIGVTHEAQGNYTEALALELDALSLRTKIGDEAKTANTLNNIGIIYDERGDPEKSLNYYFKARKIYERLGDQSRIAMVISNIGIVLKGQKEYKKVITYYHEALSIYNKLGDRFGIAACHANLGSVYFNLPNYDSSIYYSLLAEQEFGAQGISQFLPVTLCNAGIAYDELGQKEKAKEYLLKAVKLYEEYDNKKELSFVLSHLAKIYEQEGKPDKGMEIAQRALAIAKKINALDEVMNAEKALANLKASKQDYKGAYLQQQQYDITKDSLFHEEKGKAVAELQARYETEKKENEIHLLRGENEIKDFKLQRNQIFIFSLIFMMITLVGLGYLWRNRVALKQRAEMEYTKASLKESQLQAVITSQEEERKRFAADLHDGMGQMISVLRLNLSKENVERSSLHKSMGILNEMNGEIRDIAFNLMPQVLMKGGLLDALREFASRINLSEKIQFTVQAYDFKNELPGPQKIALYRICQEWVNNVIKYSFCKTVILQLVQHEDELVITIEDDGRGFDPAILMDGEGNGWRNINSRLGLIKGGIEIDSQPDRKGTTMVVNVPSSKLVA